MMPRRKPQNADLRLWRSRHLLGLADVAIVENRNKPTAAHKVTRNRGRYECETGGEVGVCIQHEIEDPLDAAGDGVMQAPSPIRKVTR